MNQATKQSNGYICPARGCDKKKNRRFSAIGLTMHIISKHGESYFAKRMDVKKKSR